MKHISTELVRQFPNCFPPLFSITFIPHIPKPDKKRSFDGLLSFMVYIKSTKQALLILVTFTFLSVSNNLGVYDLHFSFFTIALSLLICEASEFALFQTSIHTYTFLILSKCDPVPENVHSPRGSMPAEMAVLPFPALFRSVFLLLVFTLERVASDFAPLFSERKQFVCILVLHASCPIVLRST